MPSFSRGKQYAIRHDKSASLSSSGTLPSPTTGGGISSTLPPNLRKSQRKKKRRFGTTKARSSARRQKRTHIQHKNEQKQPLIATDSMVLHELVPNVPMPNEVELNVLFAQIVDELGLNRELMVQLPPEKKWQLYLSRRQDFQGRTGTLSETVQPQFYIEELLHLNEIIQNATVEEVDFEANVKIAKDLKTALRTQPVSFVLQFIDLNGLEYLQDFLRSMNHSVRQGQLHFNIIGCIKAVMNNADGRAHVLAHPSCIGVIAQSLKTTNIKIKILTLEILGALCLIPGGHRKVLNAMIQFQHYACERTRFQTLVNDLLYSLEEEQDGSNLQISILSFLNALINYKAGQESLEFRLHLRHELMMLGIHPIIIKLRLLNITQLNKHLDIFEYLRVEDEKEFASRLHIMERIDYSNAVKMAELLQKKTAYTPAYVHLISLLYHCLLIPVGDSNYEKYWRLIDRMVQQAVIQQDHGVDPDVSPLPINIQKLILHLLHEDEQRALIKQMEDMKRAQEHMILRIKKMEWECERTLLEKDAYKNTTEKLRMTLDMKVQENTILKDKQLEMENRDIKNNQKIEELRTRCDQLEERLKDKQIDISDLPKSPVVTPAAPSLPPPPPPPVPPPPGGSVPPPPPPMGGSGDKDGHKTIPPGFATLRRKKILKANTPVKSYNWEKLNDVSRIRHSVWEKMDESVLYESINFQDLEKTFSTKGPTSSFGTLPRHKNKSAEKTFIDPKRAQNCAILLTKLKMNNNEIRRLVITMDSENKIGKDMLEQLLKYVPTVDDRTVLHENLEDMDKFSRADKFLLDMSYIKHYEARLQTMFLLKTFNERMNEIRPSIDDITASCNELMMSSKLRRMLEVVLAFGNYMNKGQRGNAYGFKLSSLNKLVDTKATTDSDMNLLHYLIQTLEAKFPEVLTLEVDLPNVSKASKIDLSDLKSDFMKIKDELRLVKEELDYHRSNPSGDESEYYISAVEGFSIHSAISVRETEHMLNVMQEQFQKALVYFGEDPGTKELSTDKFLGMFDKFLKSFGEAHVQLLSMRKKKEEESKRKKEEEQRKLETLKKRKSRAMSGVSVDSTSSMDGNFEDLITKLTTGEAFKDFGQGKKRVKRMSTNQTLLHAWNQISRDRITVAEVAEIVKLDNKQKKKENNKQPAAE